MSDGTRPALGLSPRLPLPAPPDSASNTSHRSFKLGHSLPHPVPSPASVNLPGATCAGPEASSCQAQTQPEGQPPRHVCNPRSEAKREQAGGRTGFVTS